jgi:hypothetical protein
VWELAGDAWVVGDLPRREWLRVAARLRGAAARLRGAAASRKEQEPEHPATNAPGISWRRDSSLGGIRRLA